MHRRVRLKPDTTISGVAILAGTMLLSACSDGIGPTVVPPGTSGFTVFSGAGDIADCGLQGAEATARLLDALPGTFFTLGDNAYPSGTLLDYARCYEPTWGRHLERTRPSPGNHDYETPSASAYFSYFGERAGPPGLGYYSFRIGSWQVISLNSEIAMSPGSAQLAFLRAELAIRSRCTLAYWHRPLFSSGPNGDYPLARDLWRALYEFDADVILSGHDHLYERFAPQDPDGLADPRRGIRQFVVGTGGGLPSPIPTIRRPNSELVFSGWGVLKLTLGEGSYQWEFVPTAAGALLDSGTGACH